MDKSFSPHKINNQSKLGLFFIRVSSSTSLDKKKWDIFIGKVQFMCAYDIDARFIYFFSKGKKSMDFIAISSYLMAIIKYSCCCVFLFYIKFKPKHAIQVSFLWWYCLSYGNFSLWLPQNAMFFSLSLLCFNFLWYLFFTLFFSAFIFLRYARWQIHTNKQRMIRNSSLIFIILNSLFVTIHDCQQSIWINK